MSTNYYLVQADPTPFYGQVVVARTSGRRTYMCLDDPTSEWVDADGRWAGVPNVTLPASLADLKALVASGRYRLMDEYGRQRDVEEECGK